MTADLHIHTKISDGKNTPEEVVALAKSENIDTIAITDHDAVEGIDAAMGRGRDLKVNVIPGIEISCKENGNDVHILGYLIDWKNEYLLEFIKSQRNQRNIYLSEQIKSINQHFGSDITFEEVIGNSKTPTKTHLANVMVKRGLAKDVRDAIENYMLKGGPCYIEMKERESNPVDAIRAIHAAGGAAIWAHPLYPPRVETSQIDFLYYLLHNDLDGVEHFFYYEEYESKINPEFRRQLESTAKKEKLLLTGGSDYHGYWIRNSIGQTTVGDEVVETLYSFSR